MIKTTFFLIECVSSPKDIEVGKYYSPKGLSINPVKSTIYTDRAEAQKRLDYIADGFNMELGAYFQREYAISTFEVYKVK